MVLATPWRYDAYHPRRVYAKSEVCTMDVIDGCTAQYADDQARDACRQGARDSYLMSDLGRRDALAGGRMDAYAAGYHATDVLCGPHPSRAPFTTARWW